MQEYLSRTAIVIALGAALAGCSSNPSPPPADSVAVSKRGGEKVQSLTEIEGLRQDLAQLRNDVEIQRNELNKLTKRQRELYDDLDYRLRARERAGGAPQPSVNLPVTGQQSMPGAGQAPIAMGAPPPGAPPPPSGAPEYSPPPAGSGSPPPAGEPPVMQAPITATPSGQTPGGVTQVAVATAAEQAAYDAAFELLKQGRYGEAIAAFENMITQYPTGALADDGQYWVGEAWYVTRDYGRALVAFRQVINRYPDSPRLPEAMLKIGYVQTETGAKDQACNTFGDVIARYPGSRVAISAQTRRKKLEQEGVCPAS